MNKLCCEAECCRGDFLLKFEQAVEQCGGCSAVSTMALDMPLRAVIDSLAQNGLRITFKEEWHIDNQRKW